MLSLLFLKTGEIHVLSKQYTIFSNTTTELDTNKTDNCETIILPGIQAKQCAIVRDGDLISIVDFCSFLTRRGINDEDPKPLIPLKMYELRCNDRIFLGSHEILLTINADDTSMKPSFCIPETQPDLFSSLEEKIEIHDHVEIPETQVLPTDEEIFEEKYNIHHQYQLDTQPFFNKVPIFTRARSLKQAELKPKTVPLSVFDANTQAVTENSTVVPKKEPFKATKRSRCEAKQMSEKNKPKTNAVLLSDAEESDGDNNQSRQSIKAKVVTRVKNENNNSFEISVTDEFDIQSNLFDSQFMAKLNNSCEEEIVDLTENKEHEHDTANPNNIQKTDEKESVDQIESPPVQRKRRRVFKYDYSDDDE